MGVRQVQACKLTTRVGAGHPCGARHHRWDHRRAQTPLNDAQPQSRDLSEPGRNRGRLLAPALSAQVGLDT